MSKSNSNQNQNNNPKHPQQGLRHKARLTGHRRVAMQADQVDEIARMEGRGDHPNVVDARLRCPWCFLKGGAENKHACRWRTANSDRPIGGPMLLVPVYGRIVDDE